MEKKYFSSKRTHILIFGSDFGVYVAQNQRMFEDQSLFIERTKKLSALINDWENDNAYGKNPSKTRPWLLPSATHFML